MGTTSKDDIRKRLGRSTDSGDAVVQAFWTRTREGSFGGLQVARASLAGPSRRGMIPAGR